DDLQRHRERQKRDRSGVQRGDELPAPARDHECQHAGDDESAEDAQPHPPPKRRQTKITPVSLNRADGHGVKLERQNRLPTPCPAPEECQRPSQRASCQSPWPRRRDPRCRGVCRRSASLRLFSDCLRSCLHACHPCWPLLVLTRESLFFNPTGPLTNEIPFFCRVGIVIAGAAGDELAWLRVLESMMNTAFGGERGTLTALSECMTTVS